MKELKYGKLLIEKSAIIKELGLPHSGVHLESANITESGNAIEIKIIADSSVEHACLDTMHDSGRLDNIRRYRVNFGSENE